MSPDDFIEKIDILVNDENRIVTYKILSYELKIHVNKAKQCLMDFANGQKLKGVKLDIQYFLSGFVEIDGMRAIKVVIVPESKLENVKKNFVELTSFHIYSVSKGSAKDDCVLYAADIAYIKDKVEQSKYTSIRHPNIEIQPPVLNKIQINNDVKPSLTKKVPQSLSVGKSSVGSKDEPKSTIAENGVSPEKSESSKETAKESKNNKISPEDKKQKSGTLMSLWQKKEEKTNTIKKDLKPEVKRKEAAKSVSKNSIMSMFSKQAAKILEKPPVPKSSVPKEEESPKTVMPDIQKENSTSVKHVPNKKTSQKRKVSNRNSKESSKSKFNSDSENEFEPKSKKKHRRICTFDSESESEVEEEREKVQRNFFLPEEPIDVIEASPLTEDEEPIPPTPPVIHVKGRVRMWKTVQKTYEDEDGFLVTKTEKELVSASEDEEDPIKANPVKKDEVINKKNNSVNKKQASLMSFFKQK